MTTNLALVHVEAAPPEVELCRCIFGHEVWKDTFVQPVGGIAPVFAAIHKNTLRPAVSVDVNKELHRPFFSKFLFCHRMGIRGLRENQTKNKPKPDGQGKMSRHKRQPGLTSIMRLK